MEICYHGENVRSQKVTETSWQSCLISGNVSQGFYFIFKIYITFKALWETCEKRQDFMFEFKLNLVSAEATQAH